LRIGLLECNIIEYQTKWQRRLNCNFLKNNFGKEKKKKKRKKKGFISKDDYKQ
jgi:hypothetical protein